MTPQDDFSQYEVQPIDDYSQFEVKPQEEGVLSQFGRGVARVGSRIGETVLGLPGDVRELLASSVIGAAEGITGQEQPWLREKAAEAKRAPTSSELREKTAELSSGLTEPRTEGEALSDEIITDLASLSVGKIPLSRALGITLAGHGAKKGVELMGGGETAQNLTKVGTFLLTSMFKPNGAKQFTSDLYKKRDALLPEGANVDAKVFSDKLGLLEKQLKKGVPTAPENAVLKFVDELKHKSLGGRIDVDELTNVKRQINSKIDELMIQGTKPKDARQMFKPLGKAVEDAIELYGKQSNPEFLQLHKAANEAHGVMEQSQKISKAITNAVTGKTYKNNLGPLFGTGIAAAALTSPIAIASAGIKTAAGLKSMELMYRVYKSPVLRGYYADVIKHAAQENIPAMMKSLQNLDKGLSHNPKTEPTKEERK